MFTWNIQTNATATFPLKIQHQTVTRQHLFSIADNFLSLSFWLFIFFTWTVSTVRVTKYIFKSCINTLYIQQLRVVPVQNIYPPKALFKINALKIKSRKSPNRCLLFLQLLKSSNVRHKSMLTVLVYFNWLKNQIATEGFKN